MPAAPQPDPASDELLLEARRFRVVRLYESIDPDSPPRAREVVRHPGSVVLLPLMGNDRICLIRNFRVAVGQTLIELPAGTLEPGEAPAETARRELQEETGLVAGHLELLTSFYAAPGILDEHMHLFLARSLVEGPPQREPGERIENLVVGLDEAWEMVRSGDIRDAKTLVGLLYLRCLLGP